MAQVAFIPNDPLASGGPPVRVVTPHASPSGGVRFDLRPKVKAGEYAPDTAEFGHWQAHEALLLGVRAWRFVTGSHPATWFGGRPSLTVLTDAGDDLNAFYDRASLQFFHHRFGGETIHSAESVDVVCHEEGHALLDAIRPDFFDVPFIEVGVLHEAFGDCLAILAALSDDLVRQSLLAVSPDLDGTNFVESLAEELGAAIAREFGAGATEDGALRHARNAWQWADPTTLPSNAPANQLAAEVHSFARVFTGVFWDLLRLIHVAGPRTDAGLKRAARIAGSLLIDGIRSVPATPRIYDGLGRRMAAIDVVANGGADVAAIRAAFALHGMELPAPSMALPVDLGTGRSRGTVTRRLREELGVVGGTRLRYTAATSPVHGEIAHVSAYRPVPVDTQPDGLHIQVPASARVATRGGTVRGMLGDATRADPAAEAEARAFARMLIDNGDVIGAGPDAAPQRRMRGRSVAPVPPAARPANAPFPPTHAVRVVDGRRTIVRVGFA
jgi:hypothetical protein